MTPQSPAPAAGRPLTNMEAAIDALSEARDFIDRFSDVKDGDYGVPEPNDAMVMVHEINATIKQLSRPASDQPVEAIGAGREEVWRDVKDAPQDGTNILLKHRVHGVIEGWFSKGEWTDDTPISPREYTGDMWILGDDLSQDEVEFGPDREILAGSVEGWLPLDTLAAPTPMGEPVAWIERQNDGTRYGEPKRWPPSDRARSYAQEMGRTIEPLYAAAPPARTPMGEPQVLKGVGKINGDGWKDTTTKGEIVYVWNAEKPSPYAPGQYPRIDNEGWSASTAQYDFSPASVDEVRALAAPTPMGEGAKPAAWMYSHDGMDHDDECPETITRKRWPSCKEPWTEEALYTHPAPTPMGDKPEWLYLPEGEKPKDEGWQITHMTASSEEEGKRRIWIRNLPRNAPTVPLSTPRGGEVEALRKALEATVAIRWEMVGTPTDSEAATAWALALDEIAVVAAQALAASSPSPAQGGESGHVGTIEVLENLLRSGGETWLNSEQEWALKSAIAALSASPQPEAGEASEDDRAQAWLLRHYRQKAEQAGFGSLAEMMHAAAPPSFQPVEGEPVAWRVRRLTDDPEEWQLRPAGAALDFGNPKRWEIQPLYLSAPAADDGWRPIESAPKDGTEIIIYGQGWTSAPRAKWIDRDAENNEGEQITFGGWALASDWECFGVEDGFIGWNEDIDEGRMPTLWMPLPVALHPAAPTDEVGKT